MENDRRRLDGTPLANFGERRAIFAVLDSFRQLRKRLHYNTTHRRRQNLYALPRHQWTVLSQPPFNIFDTLNAVDDAIDHNADIADAILRLGLRVFNVPDTVENSSELQWHETARPHDMAKAHSTIRQFYRDWSEEGFRNEVKPILEVIISDLARNVKGVISDPAPTILLPGAGLGRIMFELCLQGYSVEGNEISYHQLLASNFVLNATSHAKQYRLYPFVNTFTNHSSREDQLREVRVPDVHPGKTIEALSQRSLADPDCRPGEMNMTVGDFITSYSDTDTQGKFSAVVTVYFIDTAPNVIRYIETVRRCLQDGGIWINVGPLLWHFDDRRIEETENQAQQEPANESNRDEDVGIGEPGSFELTNDEVLLLLAQTGFEVLSHGYLSEHVGGYIQDPSSMLQSRYRCSHWVARKSVISSA